MVCINWHSLCGKREWVEWPCIKRLCQVSTFSFWQGSDGKNAIIVADPGEWQTPHPPCSDSEIEIALAVKLRRLHAYTCTYSMH